jgi:hypothetical protein
MFPPIPQSSTSSFFPILGFLALALTASQEALASNIKVCRSGCPFASIQAAINSAQSGQTIHISPGFYEENIVITDKSLTLKGEDRSKTVINGIDQQTVVTLDCTNDQVAIRISGVSITGGVVDLSNPNPLVNPGGGMVVRQCKLLLDDSQIYENLAFGSGGGIFNPSGDVIIKDSAIFNNRASGGGGIVTLNKLFIENSSISSNTAGGPVGGGDGGGIINRGDLTVKGSTLSHNVIGDGSIGAGIYNVAGTLTLIESTLSHNQGAALANAANAVIKGSLFTKNVSLSGGILSVGGTLSFIDSLILDNSGNVAGGIMNSGGTVTLMNTTVANNTAARFGGGITNLSNSNLVLKDSLITGNIASESGGGLFNEGSVSSINTTITGNTPDNCSGVPFECP